MIVINPSKSNVMKRKFNQSNRLLLGSALAFLLLLNACQQGPDPLPGQPVYDDVLENAGEIHNQLIAYYYANRTCSSPSPEILFDELMELSFQYLVSQGYRESSLMDAKVQIAQTYGPSPLKGAGGNGFSTDPATFISQLEETGLFSREFLEEMDNMLKFAGKKEERKEIKKYVNHQFASILFDRETDRDAQQLFINIFNGSYEYWESVDQGSLKGTHLKPSSWVIINDGIGGILGMVFGPVGSIVTATVFSVGTNEEIR